MWFCESDRHDDRLALRRDPVSQFTKIGDLENRQRLRIDRDHSVYLRPDAVITMLTEEVRTSHWQIYRRLLSIACNSRHLRCTDLSRTCDQPHLRVTTRFRLFDSCLLCAIECCSRAFVAACHCFFSSR